MCPKLLVHFSPPLAPPSLILRLLPLIVAVVNYASSDLSGRTFYVVRTHLFLGGPESLVVFFYNSGSPWADDEPVDPKKELEDRCKAPCTRPLKEYQACAKRIQGDESGHKHCTGQYFDYWRCVDKCVATKLFSYLK
ncbi:Cytochrome b-c1 complex subunit-1, mitochondrial [Sesamum alatum]|uniref:Complex III subunit VI n=1 Tax=Sesamum alatum TaxID=300844 RepID=A0AAE2CY02_9LAMI|nr:Cytochrome b-c1 complex subunit-1, mitochondrial [Sesamum alatum]